MAVDMFLDLEGIKGESIDHKFKDKIDILSWSFGIANSSSVEIGSGGGVGKADFNGIQLTKYVDAASANIMLFCANGKHFKKGSIVVRKAGEKPLEYLLVSFEDALVVQYGTGGTGGDTRLTESIGLVCARIKVEYTVQTKDGGKGTTHAFGWDIPANEQWA